MGFVFLKTSKESLIMPPQISKEARQRIYELCGTKKPREILTILKLEDIDITERSIYNIKRENRETKTRNESFASFDEPFGGSSTSSVKKRRGTNSSSSTSTIGYQGGKQMIPRRVS